MEPQPPGATLRARTEPQKSVNAGRRLDILRAKTSVSCLPACVGKSANKIGGKAEGKSGNAIKRKSRGGATIDSETENTNNNKGHVGERETRRRAGESEFVKGQAESRMQNDPAQSAKTKGKRKAASAPGGEERKRKESKLIQDSPAVTRSRSSIANRVEGFHPSRLILDTTDPDFANFGAHFNTDPHLQGYRHNSSLEVARRDSYRIFHSDTGSSAVETGTSPTGSEGVQNILDSESEEGGEDPVTEDMSGSKGKVHEEGPAGPEPEFECATCGKKWTSKENLDIHVKIVHKEQTVPEPQNSEAAKQDQLGAHGTKPMQSASPQEVPEELNNGPAQNKTAVAGKSDEQDQDKDGEDGMDVGKSDEKEADEAELDRIVRKKMAEDSELELSDEDMVEEERPKSPTWDERVKGMTSIKDMIGLVFGELKKGEVEARARSDKIKADGKKVFKKVQALTDQVADIKAEVLACNEATELLGKDLRKEMDERDAKLMKEMSVKINEAIKPQPAVIDLTSGETKESWPTLGSSYASKASAAPRTTTLSIPKSGQAYSRYEGMDIFRPRNEAEAADASRRARIVRVKGVKENQFEENSDKEQAAILQTRYEKNIILNKLKPWMDPKNPELTAESFSSIKRLDWRIPTDRPRMIQATVFDAAPLQRILGLIDDEHKMNSLGLEFSVVDRIHASNQKIRDDHRAKNDLEKQRWVEAGNDPGSAPFWVAHSYRGAISGEKYISNPRPLKS